MYADRTLKNRRNVKNDVSSAANPWPCRQFFILEVHARIIAAILKVVGIEDIEAEPEQLKFSGDKSSKVDKKNYLEHIATKVVDEFVIDENKNDRILQCVEKIDVFHKARAMMLDANNRYKCRYKGK